MTPRLSVGACAAVVLFLITGTLPAATYYKLTDIGNVNGEPTRPWGINDSGQVVGFVNDYVPDRRAFAYHNGSASLISPLSMTSSYAREINNNGQITGSYVSFAENASRAFVFANGAVTNLGVLPGDYDSYGRAINNSGQVVGTSRDSSYNSHAFLYSNNTMTALGTLPGDAQSRARDINDSGQVVGYSYNVRDPHAFLYDNGTMTPLGTLGGATSYARAINDGGQVVGTASNAQDLNRAFLYSGGVMADLGTLGGRSSYAADINNSGQVVGYAETARPRVYHAFLYSDGAMVDLKNTIDPTSQWNLQQAAAINEAGVIVGFGISPSRQLRGFMLTPIDRPQASIAIPAEVADVRVMQGSTGLSVPGAMSIVEPGNTPTNYAFSTTNVAVSPATGTVAPAVVSNVPFSMGWADTAATGPRSGSLSLENLSDPSDAANHQANVTGAVVANRTLQVAQVGTALTPARAVLKRPRITSISTGSDPMVDSDDRATRINTNALGKITLGQATITYSGAQPDGPLQLQPRFDDVDESANVSLLFARTGHYTGTVNLASQASSPGTRVWKPLLTNGEDNSVGASLQPALLSYDVNVVEARRLRAATSRLSFNNILRGASVSTKFSVTSSNRYPDSDHTTLVTVAPGGMQLGQLSVGEVLVDRGRVDVPVSGVFSNYGTGTIYGSLPVVTAEAAEVGDTTAYASLPVQYTANVGIAKFGRSAAFNRGETLLYAEANGAPLANLSSRVDATDTLAANPTLASEVVSPASLTGIYGGVGSEAEIVASTPVVSGTVVSMQWRKRLPGEARAPGSINTTLPVGSYLVSDVVKINNLGPGVTYALQMSFDNRINLAIDGPINGTVANEFPNLFLAELDSWQNRWVNAASLVTPGSSAELAVQSSLADFLSDHDGVSLADLCGSWGVDPFTSATGLGHAWAIVAGGGSGIFAVDPGSALLSGSATATPEPSMLVLLSMGAAAFLVLRGRKVTGRAR